MKKDLLFIILMSFALCGCEKAQDDANITQFSVTLLSDNSIEMKVPVKEPGTLSDFIRTSDIKHLSILRLAGTLNGDDIQTIRDIMEFQVSTTGDRLFSVLDLSRCDFTAGGEFLYPKISYKNIDGESVKIIDSIWVHPSESHAIPPYAFAGVELQSILLSSNISAIGDFAFEYNSIRDFTIPSSVTSIGKGAFHFTYIQSDINIPEGVAVLPDSVFFNASQVPSITLPSTIRSLGTRCFGDCLHLSEVTVNCTNPPDCGEFMWDDWHLGTRTLYVPKGSIEKYKIHPIWGLADIITEIKH